MSAERSGQQRQVDENYIAFRALLGELMRTNPGRTALMQDGKVVACFDTDGDAVRAGRLLGGPFSIQEITDEPVDLGYFSRFGGTGSNRGRADLHLAGSHTSARS